MYTESEELSGAAYSGNAGSNSKDLSRVLIGALAGAATGSLIAGFFTEKGIETRKRIGESSKNLANNVKDKVSDITENIADKYEATKESTAELIQKGKQKVGLGSHKNAYESTGTDTKVSGSAVLLGALAVSVAGTLIWGFATEKGKETRKNLVKDSKNLASNLKEKVADIADDIADKYEAAKEGAVDLMERAKQQNDISTGNSIYKGSTGADW